MRFGILGPLQVLDDSRVVLLRRAKEKALLASLVLRAGETVSVDHLLEDLWGERVPRTAKGSLQNLVSALRKALGRELLRTRSPGYVLEVKREHVDLFRFERLLVQARALGDARDRAARLREALALWRGPLLADLAFEPFVLLEAPRLEQLRLAAHEELIEARLALGEHAELIPELETLVAEHRFDERLRGQLMLTLYRAGRQADALDRYREGSHLLVQELGLEPSAHLRDLEQAILRHEPALSPPVSARMPDILPARKLATVLYADLGPNEELDPEALARLLGQCSAVAREALERHGGMVESLPDGAVLAFFGVPSAHEDDALRAVRAATELRAELDALRGHLEPRIGISTGEVLAGGADSPGVAVGGVVVNAKRLAGAASAGEVLLDASSARLVRDAVKMEPPGRALSGEGQRGAWRFRELVEGAPAIPRRFESPLVGREHELAELRGAFQDTCSDCRCRLIVLAGEPGIGKTRLAREFLSELEGKAAVFVGRCVSYGEGATWLPLVEILRDAGAETPESLSLLLSGAPDGELIADRIAGTTGLSGEPAPIEEAIWAFRRLFETLASRRPLVLVFEDVHWAEPTLLDVVEQLAERASGPILVLCLTRPELLELRAAWDEHARNITPLPEAALVRLVDSLHASLDSATRARVVEVAEGNPLFAEQLVVYAEEEGERSLDVVPPSIEALLASRIDLLSPQEREVLQSAAVIGRRFSRTAISALMAGASTATAQLRSLIQKSLVRESRTDGVLSFQHVLVRNVAYSTIPKRARADLHERVAVWQEEHSDRVEVDEVVGYHLEQAARYKAELGQHDAGLAARAGERLAAAGRRALTQLDSRAALPLFERALLLTRPLRFDVHLEIDLARVQASPREQATVAGQVAERARERGNQAGMAVALVLAANYGMQFAEDPALDEVERLARGALPLLEDAGDHAGLALVWTVLGRTVANLHGRYEENAIAAEEALRCWELAGRRPIQLAGLSLALVDGPRPADEALKTLDSVLPPNPVMPDILFRAQLIAMLGRFEEAWEVALPAADRLREIGGIWSADPDMHLAEIAALAGDYLTAAVYLRRMCEELTRRGLQMALSGYASNLGRCLCVLGHYDDAEQLAQRGRELASEQDFGAQALWRQVLALIQANRGNHAPAETLAREAVAVVEATDALNVQGNALDDLAKVLAAAGRTGEAVDALEQSLNRYERKKNLAMVAQVRPRLAALQRSALRTRY